MDRETVKEALEAEGNERIECPVCGDQIPAYELATDHTHTTELLELVANLLPEETDEERLRRRDKKPANPNSWQEQDDPDDLIGQHSGSSASMTDNYYDEDTGGLRETIIRFDPEGVAPPSMPERLRAHEEGASIDEIDALPERRVFAVGNEEDYERISEAAWGVANAFVGSSLHAGHELVACPECGYEGSVDQAVFPGGTDHHSDAEKEEE
ncbi:hypothetical protein [Halorubrum amylolyticum]|uniref:hypothetical protein n=1 Tax=Halorubrum amylolyticum TaxID=2508724 RepID=UPI001008A17E|nr:hypothetical protein [Halorubrum amylolyticum]